MNGILPFLSIGLLLLAILMFLFARARDRSKIGLDEGDEPTQLFAIRHLPQKLTDRLFGSEDWEFINGQQSQRFTRLFIQQRTTLALAWLRALRTNSKGLMHQHVATAREHPELDSLLELRILGEYVCLQLFCRLMACVVWLRGPSELGGLITRLRALSERLSNIVERFLPSEMNEPRAIRETPHSISRGRSL
jgi:hypothetical protein